jgi:flagellar FliJ protein
MAIQQLQMVFKLEHDKEDKLAREFQQAQQHLEENKRKMAGIEDYRNEYIRQMRDKGDEGVGIGSYGHYQGFISKLEEAIKQQSTVIGTAFQVVNQRKQLWLEQQRKRKAVEMLIDKHFVAVAKKADKAEQALLDEIATQRFFRQRELKR